MERIHLETCSGKHAAPGLFSRAPTRYSRAVRINVGTWLAVLSGTGAYFVRPSDNEVIATMDERDLYVFLPLGSMSHRLPMAIRFCSRLRVPPSLAFSRNPDVASAKNTDALSHAAERV